MVAIFGWIIPAPLQIPVITTGPAGVDTIIEVALGWVSVVMMACAASNQLSSPKLETAFGKALIIFSIGKGSRITPVEKGRICSGLIFRSLARAVHVSKACFIPDSPVPALALPVFTTNARISPLRPSCAKCSRQTCTGAAQKRLRINTPATWDPGAKVITNKSLRLALLIPASAIPISKPLTGLRSAFWGRGKLTVIVWQL